ncbi:hypothetical protein KSB_63390 [Ktedonobacter robiniae]|uniref:Tn3 transposase DDE domain-containing protein n=1 Tax=Ktedonobacter robiniae TaxID=2778365 RepID=A0ABQ3UYX4_9CHLR|nr:hypothetical protein KSB_63390 [Ktedonobacter robiniae]
MQDQEVILAFSPLLLRKLASYPRQNSLAWGLREMGRLEKTLFTLEWLQSVELCWRVQIGLNKGEARNALPVRCSSIGTDEWRTARLRNNNDARKD